MAARTDFRNYFELRDDYFLSSPGYYCCGYVDTKQRMGEKLIASKGIAPLVTVTRRAEPETSRFIVVFCRVKKRAAWAFDEAMEQLKMNTGNVDRATYMLFCTMLGEDIDTNEKMMATFKPTSAQRQFFTIEPEDLW